MPRGMSEAERRRRHGEWMRTYDRQTHPANRLANVKRRVDRARNFPVNTCPASRHVEMMADALAQGRTYHMFEEEPEHCAGALYSVLESLWKARTEVKRLAALASRNPDQEGNG